MLSDTPPPAADLPPEHDHDAGTDLFVTFRIDKETFAAPLAKVQEIIRLPALVGVPMAPAALKGLANLRGRVLPIISLRRVLGFAEQPQSEQTRALVFDLGNHFGFVVDAVLSVMSIDATRIVASDRAHGADDCVSGIARLPDDALVTVLDFDCIVSRSFDGLQASAQEHRGPIHSTANRSTDDDEGEDGDASDEVRLVTFRVDGQDYAFAIENVSEIVVAPDSMTELPHAPEAFVGLVALRERLLPLLSLRHLLGLAKSSAAGQRVVVIEAPGDRQVGLVVDRVDQVLRASRRTIQPPPAMLARPEETAISGICRPDADNRLISILEPARLVSADTLAAAVDPSSEETRAMRKGTGDSDGIETEEAGERQFVIFHLGEEEFGAPIELVQEIVRVPERLTRIPHTAGWVAGVINLRGAVLPVVNLRQRLALERLDANDRQRIMVFSVAGTRIGLIVDTVSEVLKLQEAQVQPSPAGRGAHGAAFPNLVNLEKDSRIILLMDCDALFRDLDIQSLAAA